MKHFLLVFPLLSIFFLIEFTAPDCNGEEASFMLPDHIEYHEKIHHRVSGKTIDETVSIEVMLYEINRDEQFGDMCCLVYSEVIRLVEIKAGVLNLKFGLTKELPRFSSPEASLVVQVYNKNFTGEKSNRLRPRLLSQLRLNRITLSPAESEKNSKKGINKKTAGENDSYAVLLTYSPRAIEPEEDLLCRKCHEPVFKQLGEYKYQHVDFVKKHCSNCHIKNYHETMEQKEYATDGLLEFIPLQLGNAYDATITAIDTLHREETRIIPIEPASIDEFIVNTEVPPVIKDIEIVKLEKNILINIVLTWKTDKWTRALIEYGPTGMPFTGIVPEELYARNHRMEITGLPYKESYNLRITATDFFGNEAQSANYRFFTLDPIHEKTIVDRSESPTEISYKLVRIYPDFPENEDENRERPEAEIIKISPQQLLINNESLPGMARKTRVALLFTATDGIRLDIEYTKTASPDEMHEAAELKNVMESGFLQCLECHPRNISHPVMFKDARIPKDFPAARGKIMVCATCHQPHGGDSPKFIRFDSPRAVCGRCHKGRL
jgi:predicted CXXCH cytochrome family protein